MSLWDKAWPGPSIRLGQAMGAAPLDANARVPLENLPPGVRKVIGAAIVVTGDYTAKAGDLLWPDTSDGSFTIHLPADAIDGDPSVTLIDIGGTWVTHPLTVDAGAATFEDGGNPLVISEKAALDFNFYATKWRVTGAI